MGATSDAGSISSELLICGGDVSSILFRLLWLDA